MTYQLHNVPVRGGTLRVGEWAPESADAPVALAAHGVTASHLAWSVVAAAVPEVRIIAPDLRGRGASASLPGPYGMAQHAEDLAAVADYFELDRPLLVGHSMGAFVALVTKHLFRDRFLDPLLVDGGLPLELPANTTVDEALAASLGPAAERLQLTFPDAATYVDFWRAHPALQADWSDDIVAYARYDLTGEEPELRASTSLDAVSEDSAELYGSDLITDALDDRDPLILLTAPRGFVNETPGLYSPSTISHWSGLYPNLTIIEVPNVNHYTIVMGRHGASAVAREVRRSVVQTAHRF